MKFIPAKSKRQSLFHSEERKYELFSAEGIGTFLSVGCDGRGAFYGRIIKLDAAEEETFESKGGDAFITLATEVAFGGHADREWKDGRHHKEPSQNANRTDFARGSS